MVNKCWTAHIPADEPMGEGSPELVVLFNAGIDGCSGDGQMAFLYKPRLYCYRRNVGFYPNEILHAFVD